MRFEVLRPRQGLQRRSLAYRPGAAVRQVDQQRQGGDERVAINLVGWVVIAGLVASLLSCLGV